MYSDNITQKIAEAAKKIMDEQLKGNQHKIDANKNGKIDAEDFKLLKAKKEVKQEETEQIDEVAAEDYAAQNVYDKAHMAYMSKHKDEKAAHEHASKVMKQKYPHHIASKGEGQVYRLSKEEIEQLDELSKKTLGNYIQRNADDQARIGYVNAAAQHDKTTDRETKNKILDRNERQGVNRDIGLERAVKKLTKEEQEFIDELNKGTLGSYVNAAARDAVHRTAKEVETGRLDKLADKRMKGIKLATKKLAKEEVEQIDEGKMKDIYTSMMNHADKKGYTSHKQFTPKDYDTVGKEHGISGKDLAIIAGHKTAHQVAKNESFKPEIAKGFPAPGVKTHNPPPFTPDKSVKKVATAGKFGYGYSAARHLARKGMASVTKEEAEQFDEAITKTSTGYIHHARPGVYGGSEKEKHVVDTLAGPKRKELDAIEKEKKMKKSFSEMLDLINSQGLKALSEMINEEPDNETFTKELKDQEEKAAGKKKQPDLAKGAVQSVKVEEDVEQIDELKKSTLGSYVKKASKNLSDRSFDHGEDEYRQYGYGDDREEDKRVDRDEKKIATRQQGINRAATKLSKEEVEQVEERSLTEPEMKKKEEIVKSMKKGLAGFKARYGDRAKEVMYATATKQAKGE